MLAGMSELVARWFPRKATTLGKKDLKEANRIAGGAPSTPTAEPKYCTCGGTE